MDLDVGSRGSNYITIIGTDAEKLIYSGIDGFCSGNPLVSYSERVPDTINTDFHDAGSGENGTVFVFDFGSLSSGQQVDFTIFYAVAPTENVALTALNGIDAEVASLAQNGHSYFTSLQPTKAPTLFCSESFPTLEYNGNCYATLTGWGPSDTSFDCQRDHFSNKVQQFSL